MDKQQELERERDEIIREQEVPKYCHTVVAQKAVEAAKARSNRWRSNAEYALKHSKTCKTAMRAHFRTATQAKRSWKNSSRSCPDTCSITGGQCVPCR